MHLTRLSGFQQIFGGFEGVSEALQGVSLALFRVSEDSDALQGVRGRFKVFREALQ